MTDVSEFEGPGADGVRAGGEPARQSLRPPRRRRRVPLAAAALALASLVAVWVPLHRSAPARPADAVGPLAGLPGPSTAAFSTVDSPVADPAPLPDRPLARAALLYARCGGMGAVGGEFPEDCRYRLVLTDGSQYTLPISATAFGPGSISPDGSFLLVRDALESLVLRHLPSGTSRRVTVPGLEDWAGWGPVVWSPGARHAAVVVDDHHVAVLDTASASVQRTVDLAAVAAAGHYEAGLVADPFAVATDSGELSWARLAETSMTLVREDADGQRPRVVDLDLRPGELLVDLGRGVLLGDGVTAAVPVGRAHDKTEEAGLRKVHAILLVDVTTGAVRRRQELPTAISAGELHGSGCGLGPDTLVLFRWDVSDPDRPSINPTALISLNPWTGARGSGYQLSPRGLFPTLAC
ncbi:hypothetical protein ACWKSP_40155 [Micromonosporaceae bacterium Da 78-11]